MPILVNSDDAARPSPQQLFSYLRGQGATYGEALMLTGAATSESGRDPGAQHDNGIGFGMFGHNGSRLIAMRGYAADNRQDVADWRTQAGFALGELRSRPEGRAAANATTPEQIALSQMYFERPRGFSEANPEEGMNYAGRLQTIRGFTGLDPNATGAFAPSKADQQASEAAAPSTIRPATVSTPPRGLSVSFARPDANGNVPLLPYLVDRGANTLLSGLQNLFGGGRAASSPGAPAPSSAAPLQAAPAVPSPSPSPSQGAPQGGAGATNATPPLFAAGPGPASSVVQPSIGQAGAVPMMAQQPPWQGLAGLLSGAPSA